MAFIFRIFILALALAGCSAGSSRGGMKIGVDPLWYPIDFGPQTSYVNGYVEDLLLEMAKQSGSHFELIRANWDTLLDGLKKGKYDAIITTLPPYEYHLAKYDFSENILDLGPVLIVPKGSSRKDLASLHGELIGIVANDPAELIIAKEPSLILRTYNSIPELLNAVAGQDIQGALLDQIPAINFVGDLYADSLQIVGKPLTSQGIRLVARKGGIRFFDKNLSTLRKKKKLVALQEKWAI